MHCVFALSVHLRSCRKITPIRRLQAADDASRGKEHVKHE